MGGDGRIDEAKIGAVDDDAEIVAGQKALYTMERCSDRKKDPLKFGMAKQRLSTMSRAARKLAVSPKLGKVAAELLGRPARLYEDVFFVKGGVFNNRKIKQSFGRTEIHQDLKTAPVRMEDRFLTFWCPLHDISTKEGDSLPFFFPGSHRDTSMAAYHKIDDKYIDQIQDMIEFYGKEEIYAHLFGFPEGTSLNAYIEKIFNERGVLLQDGTIFPAARVPTPAQMEAQGTHVVNDGKARTLLDGHFYYSGEIPRVSAFEKGREDHLCRKDNSEEWRPDPFLMDERMLIVNVRDLGLVVFSACSHAGIVNVCTEAKRLFPDIPIHAVMGGLHLGGVMERLIPQTVEALAPFDIGHFITGHCTGWRALHALANAYGDRVSQSAVGTTYTFDAKVAPAARATRAPTTFETRPTW